jgi:hypothetical protein
LRETQDRQILYRPYTSARKARTSPPTFLFQSSLVKERTFQKTDHTC